MMAKREDYTKPPTKKEIRKNEKNLYIAQRYKKGVVWSALILIVTVVASILYNPLGSINEYSLGDKIVLNNLEFSIEEKYMNESEDSVMLRLTIQSTENKNATETELEIKSQLRGGSSKDVTLEVYRGSPEYYEILLKDIPKEWKATKIIIKDKSSKGDYISFILNRNSKSQPYYLLKEGVKFGEEYAALRSVQYEEQVANNLINKSIPEKTKRLTDEIKELENQKGELESQQQFQTDKEKYKTEQSISRINSSILQKKSDIEKANEEVKDAKDKLYLLEKKLIQLSEKYNLKVEDSKL